MSDNRYTVSELTNIVKSLIEDSLPVVTVEGELSNYVHHGSGHRYFTLKDAGSQLRCVMFKWQAGTLDFVPEEGIKLLAVGNITVYERSGQYQLNVSRLIPIGRGDLLAQFEELKLKLADEGVFDNTRPIPSFPRVIGVVTSSTGAAVRDIISVLTRRAPNVRIIVRPTLVQGIGAAPDIVDGIHALNDHTDADIIIVGRGGGSIEDLWCFNDEGVARAIASSAVPVISAVGHETDFTLADFAADLRAPTPSAAAELAVQDAAQISGMIEGYRGLLKRRVLSKVDDLSQRADSVIKELSPERFQRSIDMRGKTIESYTLRLKGAVTNAVSQQEKTIVSLTGKLAALHPGDVLNRGYSIVYRKSDNRVVTEQSMVGVGDTVFVELAHGGFGAVVEDVTAKK